jgi:hypothetical protein
MIALARTSGIVNGRPVLSSERERERERERKPQSTNPQLSDSNKNLVLT